MDTNKKKIITEIQRISSELGTKYLKCTDFQRKGNVSLTAVYKTFGSWRNAVRAAGLTIWDPSSPKVLNKRRKEIIAEMQRISSKIGTKYLTGRIFENNCKIADNGTVVRAFGSWHNAVRVAGLKICIPRSPEEKNNLKKEIIIDLQKISSELRTKYLKGSDYEGRGIVSLRTVTRAFGTWHNAIRAAGLTIWDPHSPEILNKKKKEIIAEMQRISSKLGTKCLTCKAFEDNSKMNTTTIRNIFGSWHNAVKAAGLTIWIP